MSKEDRQAIKDTDDEYKRRGFFKRIFPSPDFLYYKQFFEEERLVNYIIDAKIFAKKRGINPIQLRKHQALPYFLSKESLRQQIDSLPQPLADPKQKLKNQPQQNRN